jgi:hypothetical protein
MAFDSKGLDDYIDVAARLADFRIKHPEGSLQPVNLEKPFEIVEVAGAVFVVYTAAAYRHPDDPRPGIGIAWESVPGRTPYTRNSELMNAETSAWGRAIVAALAGDTKKSIASQQEVRNRQAEREDGPPLNKDGSLSRSRMSDEELAAAGSMTSEQTRAHGRLAKETQANPKKAERSQGPVEDDPWADGNGMVTKTQLKRIVELFDEVRWTDQADRLRATSALVGREIANAYDLSQDEAEQLIAALRLVSNDPDPATRLADMVSSLREQEGGQP